MNKVFICSAFAAESEDKHILNVKRAKAACLLAIEKYDSAPFAPHLLYPQILKDTLAPERIVGIRMGLEYLAVCDVVWQIGEIISSGMAAELAVAKHLEIPIVKISIAEVDNMLEIMGI